MVRYKQKPPPSKQFFNLGDRAETKTQLVNLGSGIFTTVHASERLELKQRLEAEPGCKEILRLSEQLNTERTDLNLAFKTPFEAWDLDSAARHKSLHESARLQIELLSDQLSMQLSFTSPGILNELVNYFSAPGYENLTALSHIVTTCEEQHLQALELKTVRAIDSIFRRKLSSLENKRRNAAREKKGAIIYNGNNLLQVSATIDFIFSIYCMVELSTYVRGESAKIVWDSLAAVEGRPVYDSAIITKKPQFFLNFLPPEAAEDGKQPAESAEKSRQT